MQDNKHSIAECLYGDRLEKLETAMLEQTAALAGIRADIRNLADHVARLMASTESIIVERTKAEARDARMARLEMEFTKMDSQVGELQRLIQQVKGIAIALGFVWPIVFWAMQKYLLP